MNKEYVGRTIKAFEDVEHIPALYATPNVRAQGCYQPSIDMLDAVIDQQDDGWKYGDMCRLGIDKILSAEYIPDFAKVMLRNTEYALRPGNLLFHAITEDGDDITLVGTVTWQRGYQADNATKEMVFSISVVAPFVKRVSLKPPHGILSEAMIDGFTDVIISAFKEEAAHVAMAKEEIDFLAMAAALRKRVPEVVPMGIYDGVDCVLRVAENGTTQVYQKTDNGLHIVGILPVLSTSCGLLPVPSVSKKEDAALTAIFSAITVKEMANENHGENFANGCEIYFLGRTRTRLTGANAKAFLT